MTSLSPSTVTPEMCSPGLPLNELAPSITGARNTEPKYEACVGFRSRSMACWNV